jgi:hypothetical protein
MSDNIQFVSPPPVPVNVPLPGLVNGRILAIKLGVSRDLEFSQGKDSGYRVLLGVRRASILNGDITYFGSCLFYVIGDKTLVWEKWLGIEVKIGRLQTMAQLLRVPDPPYLRQIRMQPYPDLSGPEAVESVSGLLIVGGGWDPLQQYYITFRGDWCPLFRHL